MPLPTICHELYVALQPLHGLCSDDLESLRTAAHVRCLLREPCDGETESDVRSYDEQLSPERQPLVTAALHLSGEVLPHSGFSVWQQFTPDERRRAIWLASILRFAESLMPLAPCAPQTVTHVIWTETLLYIELDTPGVSTERLRASAALSALEAVTGRSVVLGVTAAAPNLVA